MARKLDEISILIRHDVAFLRAIHHQTILLIPVPFPNCQVESGTPEHVHSATVMVFSRFAITPSRPALEG
jgi:hypothetical protein